MAMAGLWRFSAELASAKPRNNSLGKRSTPSARPGITRTSLPSRLSPRNLRAAVRVRVHWIAPERAVFAATGVVPNGSKNAGPYRVWRGVHKALTHIKTVGAPRRGSITSRNAHRRVLLWHNFSCATRQSDDSGHPVTRMRFDERFPGSKSR